MNKCTDIRLGHEKDKLWLDTCHGLGGLQFFGFTKDRQFVTMKNICVGADPPLQSVFLRKCSATDTMQKWKYEKDVIHRNRFW